MDLKRITSGFIVGLALAVILLIQNNIIIYNSETYMFYRKIFSSYEFNKYHNILQRIVFIIFDKHANLVIDIF